VTVASASAAAVRNGTDEQLIRLGVNDGARVLKPAPAAVVVEADRLLEVRHRPYDKPNFAAAIIPLTAGVITI
jgi:hypothetical protein